MRWHVASKLTLLQVARALIGWAVMHFPVLSAQSGNYFHPGGRIMKVFRELIMSGRWAGLLGVLLVPGMALAGFSGHQLVSAGADREYTLYIPDDIPGGAMPLVFSFHGSGGYPQSQIDTSHFDVLAEAHGFAVVFPAGAFTNSVTERSWNANGETGVDDVQFVRDMIEDIAGRVEIDRSRIYASGFSGGARISSRLGCELSDVLAAAAPVAGLQYPDDCTLKRPIPIISFHALDDQVNHYDLSGDSRPYWRMGVETALDKWRQANGCTLANEAVQVASGITKYMWSSCDTDAVIQFYQTVSGRHTWPGSDSSGALQNMDASELIWEFFRQHRLP